MIRGKLESVRLGVLAGWLWDDQRPNAHLSFDLLINNIPVGRFKADRLRGDLRRRQVGQGDHAFNVPLPRVWQNPGVYEARIEVEGAESDQVLPFRFIINQSPPVLGRISDSEAGGFDVDQAALPATETLHRRLRGRLERIVNGVLHGWLWDTDNDQPVRFALLINEKAVGEFTASNQRQDLVRAGIGTGCHAFRVKLDGNWFSPGDNIVTVRSLPELQRLPDVLVFQRPQPNVSSAGEFEAAGLSNDSTGASEVVYRKKVNDPQAADPDTVSLDKSVAPSSDRAMAKAAGEKNTTFEISNPSNISTRQVVAAMQNWSTERLIQFHATLEKDLLLQRAKELWRKKEWTEIAKFAATTTPSRPGRIDLDLLIGRALLNSGSFEAASGILFATAKTNKESASTSFYASVAFSRAGNYDLAVSLGRTALELDTENSQYLIDHATNCRRYAARLDADTNLKRSVLMESVEAYRRAISVGPNRHDFCLLNIARNQIDLDLLCEAASTLKHLLQFQPDNVDGLILMSQVLVAQNRIKEALKIAERVVELDPMRQGPRFQLRALQGLVQEEDQRPATFGIARWCGDKRSVSIERIVAREGKFKIEAESWLEFAANPSMSLSSIAIDWLLIYDDSLADPTADVDGLHRAQANAMRWAGRIVGTLNGRSVEFWRQDLLVGLAQSGVIENIGTLRRSISAVAHMVASVNFDAVKSSTINLGRDLKSLQPGTVVVMSRHGIVKFGGGEHFLESMAEHYAGMGFDPIIVGTRPERVGEEGVENGRRFAFVDMSPSALRAYFLRVQPRFVHVLSGLGFQTAEALDYLNTPFVYGVHFWRDCLGLAENDMRFFLAHDRQPIPKPSFRYVIEKASTVYSNSEYTKSVLEECFNIRTPVVYSLPREVTDLLPGTSEEVDQVTGGARDYVLLVNAKSDKGFDLMIETAKRVPHARFLAIASQSDRREAEMMIAAAGLTNFQIVGHTNRMDLVYSRARAVAVPSYRFVETFSRVCIEAQRYGKPVLGCTIGNVPYLLRQSGVILPEDVHAWSAEIDHIYTDLLYYSDLCRRASQNSGNYSYGQQRLAVDGLISTIPSKVLVGVGSGIGNMLHVAPMIRNIARRLGRKVDLVMTEDHQNSLFLLQNDAYVNTVYSLRQEILRRNYDAVFITHSFGSARLPFQNQNVLYSRDWQNFEPSGPLHETIYNLEAAKNLLGVPYEEEDITGYYVGNYRYQIPNGPTVVGMHGGSKDGFWRSKRWPGHHALAEQLQKRGVMVTSFGIPEEYVPGTIDATGGTISEMIERMLSVSYFISNDSGVMNIANALGIPVMGLFGPTNGATRGPIGPRSRWLSIEKPCSPCEVTKVGRETFMSGACQCINELPLQTVASAVEAHMEELGLLPSSTRT